jgi:AAA+ superfamily predicted ATPase
VSREEAELALTSGLDNDADQKTLVALQRRRRQIAARRKASAKHGTHLTLPALAELFQLSALEELLLVACLAAECADRHGKIYGYLHDDLTRKQPSIQLISNLSRLDPSFGSTAAVGILVPDSEAPLFRWELVNSDSGSPLPHIARGWWIDQRIAAYLLERPQVDARLGPALREVGGADEQLPGDDEVERGIRNVIENRRAGIVVFFHGPGAETGERIAARVSRRLGAGLIHADSALLVDASHAGATNFSSTVRRLYREALLQGAAVYVSNFDQLGNDARSNTHVRAFEDALRDISWITFIEGESVWLPSSDSTAVSFLPFYLGRSSYEMRRTAWKRALAGRIDAPATNVLATRYQLTSRGIRRALQLAETHADARLQPTLEYADIVWACRLHSRASLDGFAQTIAPRARWEDLVLPEVVLQQLREICSHARHRATVLHEWGFDRLLSTGKGVYALFVGPGGTGKTLAAEVLANTLDRDLVKVDLASVVSKYVGDTEKHLQRVFDATEHGDAILFFDEADALFGKRSEIKDAHDRYANIEVGFLLQRLDTYEGFVILASNLATNMDPAFARRMQFTVDFPFPDESSRRAIWKRHLPPETPVADDIDLTWLSRELKIAGGNIRNVVLNAAFMAADEAGRLSMRHLVYAARREYTRLGKVYRLSDVPGVKEAVG